MTAWTKWCLSEADVVLDLCLAAKGPFLSGLESQVFQYAGLHCDLCLVLLHGPETVLPRGTADWLYRRKSYLETHYHVKMANEPLNLHSDMARLSRHILGLDVGLVLGGGGARGAARIPSIQRDEALSIYGVYLCVNTLNKSVGRRLLSRGRLPTGRTIFHCLGGRDVVAITSRDRPWTCHSTVSFFFFFQRRRATH